MRAALLTLLASTALACGTTNTATPSTAATGTPGSAASTGRASASSAGSSGVASTTGAAASTSSSTTSNTTAGTTSSTSSGTTGNTHGSASTGSTGSTGITGITGITGSTGSTASSTGTSTGTSATGAATSGAGTSGASTTGTGTTGGSGQGALTGHGAFASAFVGSDLASNVDDSNFLYDALYVTFFASDLSGSWPSLCASVSASVVPGTGSYVQLELLTPQGNAIAPGVYPVGQQYAGLANDYAKVSGGTSAAPGTLTATSGQVSVTQVGSDGSASGSFSVTVQDAQGTGTLSGTFTGTLGCAASAPDGGLADGGAPGGGCGAGGSSTFATCTTSADCACPDTCVNDPYLSPIDGSSVCEPPCQTSADCADLATFCQAGACNLSPCDSTQYDAACTTGDGQPGSCLDDNLTGSIQAVWTCALAGTATTACDPVAGPVRANLAARCVGGDTCDTDNGYDQCVPLCDPSATTSTCTNGYSCTAEGPFSATGFCGP